MFKIILACLVLTLCSVKGHAADLLFTWDSATIRADGSSITGEIGYVIRYSIDNVEQPLITLGNVNSYPLTDIQAGVYSVQIATTEDGFQGGWSPVLTKTISEIPLAPPASVIIQVDLTNCPDCGLEIK